MKFLPFAIFMLGLVGSEASAESQSRICSKYSTILVSDGETVEVNGAGQYSLFLLIKGPRGTWIFFDSMSEPSKADSEGLLVLTGPSATAYRRSHDSRIYAILPAEPVMTDGRIVKTGVMGVDVMREPLDNAAIKGDNSDLDIIERVKPGMIGACDLRFVAGKGLVRSGAEK